MPHRCLAPPHHARPAGSLLAPCVSSRPACVAHAEQEALGEPTMHCALTGCTATFRVLDGHCWRAAGSANDGGALRTGGPVTSGEACAGAAATAATGVAGAAAVAMANVA